MKRFITETDLKGNKETVCFEIIKTTKKHTVMVASSIYGVFAIKYETPWVTKNYAKNGKLTRYGFRRLCDDAQMGYDNIKHDSANGNPEIGDRVRITLEDKQYNRRLGKVTEDDGFGLKKHYQYGILLDGDKDPTGFDSGDFEIIGVKLTI